MSALYALLIIPILGFLILIHEIGHYVTAKRAGMRVEEFGMGIPPRIWGFKRGETLWSINAIPFGGFVRVLGEDGKEWGPQSMLSKSAGQRALFITGGVIMNLIAAFALMFVLVAFLGEAQYRAYVTGVVPDSPAAVAGWQAGDRFVRFAGERIDSGEELSDLTAQHAGESVSVVIERDGQLIDTTVEPRENPPAGEGRTGIRVGEAPVGTVEVREVPEGSVAAAIGLREDDIIREVNGQPITDRWAYLLAVGNSAGTTIPIIVERGGEVVTLQAQIPATLPDDTEPLGSELRSNIDFERYSLSEIPVKTVTQFFSTIQRMGEGLIDLIRGAAPLDDVAGPIGMGQLTAEVIDESPMPVWVTIVNITFILSLNLAILNLLPLPALDGGRLVFVIIEVLRRGKRIAPEKEGLVHAVGIVVLLTFMFVIAFVDINRLISGNSLLE